jgi:hypothetical protein
MGIAVSILALAVMACSSKVAEMIHILQAFRNKIDQLDDRQIIQNERINNINMTLKEKIN